jgi:hypothetical protein
MRPPHHTTPRLPLWPDDVPRSTCRRVGAGGALPERSARARARAEEQGTTVAAQHRMLHARRVPASARPQDQDPPRLPALPCPAAAAREAGADRASRATGGRPPSTAS